MQPPKQKATFTWNLATLVSLNLKASKELWRSSLPGTFSRPGKMTGSVGQPRLSSSSISSLSAGLMARRFLAKMP